MEPAAASVSAGAQNGFDKGSKKSVSTSKKQIVADKKKRKIPASEIIENPTVSRKMPKRVAACSDFREKPFFESKTDHMIEAKKEGVAVEEMFAIRLTSGQDDGRPCRRLTDFTLHDSDGISQPFEMLEVNDIFVSGLILPLEESGEQEKDKGIRCLGFGRVEEWSISGYEDGSPIIWISTESADYDCMKPSASYKKFFDQLFAKATACIEVYKVLSKSSGGITLDELLAGVVRVMSGMKYFSGAASIRDFIVFQGSFIYNQLIGLDDTSKKVDQLFVEQPVLADLRNESSKFTELAQAHPGSLPGNLRIGPKHGDEKINDLCDASSPREDEDSKLARVLQEEEHWRALKRKKSRGSATSSNNYYIKINEDEIANDYPLPAYYKISREETDEYIIFDSGLDVQHIEDLPMSILHDWSLYNSDERLVSLELLPLKPCAEIDVTIFGSGVMANDDGSGYNCDGDSVSPSSGSGDVSPEGIPVFLSPIKEWVIDFGSSIVSISIRTDLSWYRLGKPSKQYAPWYEQVLKVSRLAVSAIALLKGQSRVARLSFADVVKRISEFSKDHPAFISSNSELVERYIVVHGPIILQKFSEYPDESIKKCAFVTGLIQKMEARHHTKWLVKKKKLLSRIEQNLNPRAAIAPVVSKRKAMQATTTKLINRIWGEYYSNHIPEELHERLCLEETEADEVEEQDENEEDDSLEEKLTAPERTQSPSSGTGQNRSYSVSNKVKWDGQSIGKLHTGEALYNKAIFYSEKIAVGNSVLLQVCAGDDKPAIIFVEYMYETLDGHKMVHGRCMLRGCQTVLENTANGRELFLTNDCMDIQLEEVEQSICLDIRNVPWGHEHRKANTNADKIDRARADERKKKGLPTEYYCKSLYCPEKGAFFALPYRSMGLGSGSCQACRLKDAESETEKFKIVPSLSSFVFKGTEYSLHDYIYVSPYCFSSEREAEIHKAGRNVGLKAYTICQMLEICDLKMPKKLDASSVQVKVRRFFRPEDISAEKAYASDIREVYYSAEMHTVPADMIEGKCEVRKKKDLVSEDAPLVLDHIFFCECLYDPASGAVKQLPSNIKLTYSTGERSHGAATWMKKKGKFKEGETDLEFSKNTEESCWARLATLDIFAGCGGLSEGLQKSGVSSTKWAIEYDKAAGEAFRQNNPGCSVFINNCNVILRAVMDKCGDADDCISTSEASELAASLEKSEIDSLPQPGEVDFINGGPPCQGFSGMNRFNQSTWSKVQCEMVLAFLSFADYYRPKFFLLENVRNFVSFNQGQTFKLTLASLLEMGYQVRFGILEAGAYGVPQSRKRAFIWAASPEEHLPEWPEPMHVFAAPELRISLSKNLHYAAVRSTARGAPLRPLTVRDTIGDLPPVGNGASKTSLEYVGDPISWFQKKIRGSMDMLNDHISKEMNELNQIRCKKIPKRPGADWRDLPDEKVKLSTGQMADLIPWCLPNTAKRHNQWKGLFGRLDWEGNFPTSITDPQPMGKVGMCFHPEQDRIVTVRECARSQGFPDGFKFFGNVLDKHRQIGNAVPPPLAYALGVKLKEAVKKGQAAPDPSMGSQFSN